MTIWSEESSSGSPPAAAPGSPVEVVRAFLTALADGDLDGAIALIDDAIVYENVGLPTIHGRDRFEKGFRSFQRYRLGFDVRIHRIAEENGAVLTERTDAIFRGGYRSQFWVCGTFEVRDGRITLWRDYFDFWAVTRSIFRGLAGIVVPGARARFVDEG